MRSLSLKQARRLSLKSQGFGRTPTLHDPSWRTIKAHLEQMQILQIDAINTVIRSHYLPLFSRMGAYDRACLDRKLFSQSEQSASKRTFFEYWGHECSLMPIRHYPLFAWRRENAKRGIGVYKQIHELAQRRAKLVAALKQQLLEEGPLAYSDLESDPRGSGMWEWSQTKQALEYLFWTGELASAGRRGFQRLYAAPERVVPSKFLNAAPTDKLTQQMTLLEISAKALGVATEPDLRDYFRLPAADAKNALAELLAAGHLETVEVENWTVPAYVLPSVVIPRRVNSCALLSPFDPIVWCRPRTKRLFDFHYRIEIYVPANKRVYGYWVMPFLLGDELVARVDLKAIREASCLEVKGLWLEDNCTIDHVAPRLAPALKELAQWLGLERVRILGRGRALGALRSHVSTSSTGTTA